MSENPNAISDPRPHFASATAWVTGLFRAIRPDQLDAPTPCTEFDVRELCSHLVMTVCRAVAIAELGDVSSVGPGQPDDVDSYVDAAARAIELWRDDALLGRPVRVPWGEVPGAGALWGYVNEQFVHGWDLAAAIGQPTEADPAMVEPVLAVVQRFIVPEREDMPFADVVDPRPGAGPTERLANWSGRSANWQAAAARS